MDFSPTAQQRPSAQSRLAKTHFALFVLNSVALLLVLCIGTVMLGHVPWELGAVIAATVPFFYALRRGTLTGKAWARYGTVAAGILLLPGFPIWTAAGLYLIVDASFNWNR